MWLEEFLDSVSIQRIFDQRTTAHNDEDSPWQLLLGRTPTDKSVCENPELSQCSVEVVSPCEGRVVQSVHRRGSVTSKTSQKNSSSPTLETNGVGIEIWQTQGFENERWCFFLGRARVLIQERETTAEGVRMEGVVWSQRVLLLFGVLYSTCVLFPSLRNDCAALRTQNPSSVSKTLSDVCHTAHFLISRHRQMLLMMLGKTKSQVGTHEAHEIQAVAVLSGRHLMQHHVWDLI